MFEFMVLQCVAIALLILFPQIATYLPDQLRAGTAAEKVEQIDDSANRLEEDPLKGTAEPVGPADRPDLPSGRETPSETRTQ
jgi:hypothetical protein